MSVFEEINKSIKDYSIPDVVTRKHVGLQKTAPFVKGYWYLYIDLPKAMKDSLNYDINLWRKVFAGLSVNFTPPNRTLNYADIQHLGGTSKHYTGFTKGNDFSITYNELSGAPIYKFHTIWGRLVADNLMSVGNVDVIGEEYKTTFLVIQTKPVGSKMVNGQFQFKPEHIERVYLLIGVTPPSDDQSGAFDSDISSPGNLQLSYSYTCDDWMDEIDAPVLKEKAADILNNKLFKDSIFADTKKLLENTTYTGGIFGSNSGG